MLTKSYFIISFISLVWHKRPTQIDKSCHPEEWGLCLMHSLNGLTKWAYIYKRTMGNKQKFPCIFFRSFIPMKTPERWRTSRDPCYKVPSPQSPFAMMDRHTQSVNRRTHTHTHTQTDGTNSITSTASLTREVKKYISIRFGTQHKGQCKIMETNSSNYNNCLAWRVFSYSLPLGFSISRRKVIATCPP